MIVGAGFGLLFCLCPSFSHLLCVFIPAETGGVLLFGCQHRNMGPLQDHDLTLIYSVPHAMEQSCV